MSAPYERWALAILTALEPAGDVGAAVENLAATMKFDGRKQIQLLKADLERLEVFKMVRREVSNRRTRWTVTIEGIEWLNKRRSGSE